MDISTHISTSIGIQRAFDQVATATQIADLQASQAAFNNSPGKTDAESVVKIIESTRQMQDSSQSPGAKSASTGGRVSTRA